MNCRHRSIHQFTHDGKYNSIIFRRMKSNFKPGSYYNIIAVTCMNKNIRMVVSIITCYYTKKIPLKNNHLSVSAIHANIMIVSM